MVDGMSGSRRSFCVTYAVLISLRAEWARVRALVSQPARTEFAPQPRARLLHTILNFPLVLVMRTGSTQPQRRMSRGPCCLSRCQEGQGLWLFKSAGLSVFGTQKAKTRDLEDVTVRVACDGVVLVNVLVATLLQ